MSLAIHWHLMFRVSNKRAFDKCLDHVLPLLGNEHEKSDAEPYWKIPELWETVVITPIPDCSAAEQIGRVILVAQRLARGWCIQGSPSAESAEGFGGVFSLGFNKGVSKVPGLEWAAFDIRSQPMWESV